MYIQAWYKVQYIAMFRIMRTLLNTKVLAIFVLMFSFLGACSAKKDDYKKAKAEAKKSRVVEVVKDWCLDCKKMEPIMASAKEKFGEQIEFEQIKLGSKEAKELADLIKDQEPPVYVMFNRQGKHLATFAGAGPEAEVHKIFTYVAFNESFDDLAKEQQAAAIPDVPVLDLYKGKPALVFHYADWCPYCRKLRPLVQQLKEEFKGKMEVVEWNVDEENFRELAKKYRPKPGGIPYIQFFDKNGKYQGESLGAVPEATLRKRIKDKLGV